MKKWLKSENASMTVYVVVAIFSFMIILTSVFLAASAVRKNQLQTIPKIKEVYEKDLANIEQIYEDREAQEQQYVTEGLILHYDGINNTGNGHSTTTATWKDLSGNDNDGTLSKTPNSSDFYWEEDHLTVSNANVELGVYIDTPINLNQKERTISYTIDASNLSGSIWGDTTDSNTSGLFNYYNFIANRGTSSNLQDRIQYTFNKSGIYHYTVTLSSNEMKFYENGELVTSVPNTTGLATTNNLRILAAYYYDQNATNLKMYNFMVYDRALNQSEIQQNFQIIQKRFNVSDSKEYIQTGLILHYDGINNTGDAHSTTTTTWKDLSGNGNDGTLSKTPNTSNFSWQTNHIALSNVGSSSGTYIDTPVNLNGQERTITYTIDATNLTGTIWGDTTSSSNTNGVFHYYQFITNRGNSQVGQNKFEYTFSRSGIYQYTLTLSNTEMKFYCNGNLIYNTANTVGLKTSNDLRLLAAYNSSQNSTNLKMYNFMVYNRALTESEVQTNFQVDQQRFEINT